MGSSFSRVFRSVLGAKREVRLLTVGLDASGKTTMLYKMKLGEIVTTIPTIGMNVESVEYKNINLTAIDIGGRGMIRPLMRHYYQSTSGIVFCVDSNDRERIGEAENELQRMLREDELNGVPLLVFANKQDLPNAMSIAEITDKLSLHSLRNRKWCIRNINPPSHIQQSCFTSGDGMYEGLEWLSSVVGERIGEESPSTGLWSRIFGSSAAKSSPSQEQDSASKPVTESPPPSSGAVVA